MDIVSGLLLAIGAFYVFAGLVTTRAALVSLLLDRGIAAITSKPMPKAEALQAAWLIAAANVVLAGGAALMLRLDLALWLFAISLAGQALYLFVVAPLYFDVGDPPDAIGRRQSTNAFLVYAVATAIVAVAAYHGRLLPWRDAPAALSALAVAGVLGHAVHTLWQVHLAMRPGPAHTCEDIEPHAPEARDVKRIAVMADHYRFPIWSMTDGPESDLRPEDFALSTELCRDLGDWAEAYLASQHASDPQDTAWSRQQHAAHQRQGLELARRIAHERPDLEVHAFSSESGFIAVSGGDKTL